MSETQKLLKTFISPNTPYNGLLVYHGVGVGKHVRLYRLPRDLLIF